MALTEIPIELSSTPGIVDNSTSTAITIDSSNNTNFADNAKAIFGAGSDLQIFHDASDSYIKDEGTGNLYLTTNGSTMNLQAGSDNMVKIYKDAQVEIFHDASVKLATTATGIDVTGSVTADGLTVDGSDGATIGTIQDGAQQLLLSTDSIKVSRSASSNGGLTLGTNSQTWGANGGFVNVTTDAVKRISVDKGGDISFYEDTGTTAKFFWDASAESLGIGTDSPSAPLDIVSSATGGTTIELDNTSTGGRNFTLYSSGSGNSFGAGNFALYDADAAAVRMLVDSSGNLLVGKTATGLANAGVEFTASNILRTTKADSASAEFNRTGTDGDIAIFWKNTSPVGSIGVYNGVPYIGYSEATGGGIMFNGKSIEPTAVGSSRTDGENDIGSANYRWKDLHLSGGVVFGATGGAVTSKTLDDYEEGTWTPEITGGATSITYVDQIGTYTKVGRMVMLRCLVTGTWTTTGGISTFGGLPYTANSGGTWASSGQGSFYDTTLDRHFPVVPAGGSSFYMVDVNGTRGIFTSAATTQTAFELMFLYEAA